MTRAILLGIAHLSLIVFAVEGTMAQHANPHATGMPQAPGQRSPTVEPDDLTAFIEAVDLDSLGQIAVHTRGRIKSLDSFARGMMQRVYGSRHAYQDRPAIVNYLDFMLVPEAYALEPIIYVKNKELRARLKNALEVSLKQDHAALQQAAQRDNRIATVLSKFQHQVDAFIDTGMICNLLLDDPRVVATLEDAGQDIRTMARHVQEMNSARTISSSEFLRRSLAIVPPPVSHAPEHETDPTGYDASWYIIDEVASGAPGRDKRPIRGELESKLVNTWIQLEEQWKQRNAEGVNATAATMRKVLPQINSEIYPDMKRLSLETTYFKWKSFTWVWILYAFALPALLLAVVFKWPAAKWVGLIIFLIAFGLHTYSLGLRWYVSGRWPNSNMFEAITTAAWFGGCFAVLFELFGRRLPLAGMIALGSSLASMCALMAVHFLPLQLNAHIENRMPVLHDIWLYIHTNVIIFSYCLIFMAAMSALIYLLYRFIGTMNGFGGSGEYARVGGAGSLMVTTPTGETYLSRGTTTLGHVLDGTTMILMELSFVLLWAGIVMGAIWADHSWGRPWGWDPKEVFALNTFIIFAILVHTRLKVKDKGMWTAILAIVGCIVMIFNWVIINFAISGLHSYA